MKHKVEETREINIQSNIEENKDINMIANPEEIRKINLQTNIEKIKEIDMQPIVEEIRKIEMQPKDEEITEDKNEHIGEVNMNNKNDQMEVENINRQDEKIVGDNMNHQDEKIEGDNMNIEDYEYIFKNPNFDLPEDAREIDYFNLFFDDNLFNNLVDESSRYFKIKFSQSIRENKKHTYGYFFNKNGLNTTYIRAYIAILIYMGLEPKAKITKYWSEDKFHSNSFIPKIMCKNFFYYLSAALHLSDDTEEKEKDPRAKILPFIKSLCAKFRQVYTLSQKICIDESLVYFRGRSKMKFYIPNKPAKWGFKLHLLCDSENNYCYNIIFDPGQTEKNFIRLDGTPYIHSIILRLVEGLENRGHILFFDTWYSSIAIIKKLRSMNIFVTSLLKQNHKILRTEETTIKLDEDIMIYKIEDKKMMNFITSIHDDHINAEGLAEVHYEYKTYSRAVDRVNQSSSFHTYKNRNKKWWKRVFYFLIDVSITNSFILMELNKKRKLDMIEFRKKLIYQLLEGMEIEELDKNKIINQTVIPWKYISLLHDISHLDHRKRCKKCKKNTAYYCQRCSIHLHPECFLKYHVKNIYMINQLDHQNIE